MLNEDIQRYHMEVIIYLRVQEPKGPWFKSRSDHRIFLSKKLIPRLLLSTQDHKWVPVREKSQCAVAAYCAECKRTTYIPVIGGKCQSRLKMSLVS
ncbi:hypothetical protein DPMN_090112 [Dreissena polymorpha]|uniref:Uncharacterized protein n=1 Tax=Dreissena polymorpha TaxID=45954 RepID=A0A9D4KZJ4_DREPO|nr:hypothetical protein DPMN_090112 [Dreissena polymorpha]